MSTPIEREIAATLEADPELLPYLPVMLQDLDELGGQSHHLVELLRTRRLPQGSRALDLGCGKGALAFRLAEEFGWYVLGVDLFAPFVEQAQCTARERDMSERCRFVQGDAREWLKSPVAPVDVALLFSVGKLYGSLGDTVKAMRRAVRPGGILAIEEMYLKPNTNSGTDIYEVFNTREALVAELTAHGDRVVASREYEIEEVAAWNAHSMEKIGQRANELAARREDLRPLIERYVQTQRNACRALETSIICGIWLLERR